MFQNEKKKKKKKKKNWKKKLKKNWKKGGLVSDKEGRVRCSKSVNSKSIKTKQKKYDSDKSLVTVCPLKFIESLSSLQSLVLTFNKL